MTKMSKIAAAAALAVVTLGLLSPRSASANSVATFEDINQIAVGHITGAGPNYVTFGAGAVLDGWTVTGSGVDLITSPSYSPPSTPPSYAPGQHAIDLNALDTGGLTQTFTGLSGGRYDFSFWLSGNGVSSPPVDPLTVTIVSPTSTVSEQFSANFWSKKDIGLTLGQSNGPMTISITSGNTGTGGPTIDDIRLTAVPIPAAAKVALAIFATLGVGKLFRRITRRHLAI